MNEPWTFLHQRLYKLSGWDDTKDVIGKDFMTGVTMTLAAPLEEDEVPYYDTDYLSRKLKNYDFVITNLNHDEYQIVSDSLDDSGAIIGKGLNDVLLLLAIELFEQGEKW